MLNGRRVLLGVTGSIAAYQAVDLVGLLRAEMADVRVILTRAGERFITALSLEVVSGHPVTTRLFGPRTGGVEHVALARAADLLLVAPATAQSLAKLANGLAGDALSATALAFRGPVVVAPAMNEGMWMHPAVVENVERLRRRGVRFVDPEYGPMACGGEGWGRLARLDRIVAETSRAIEEAVPLAAAAANEAARELLEPNEVVGAAR
jgi:phosphopantothenoylcysteine decarboxylase/phosphopantothenate--cysteine ligase